MARLAVKARTALALGLPNLARAFLYRIGVRTGLNSVRRLQAHTPSGPFFVASTVATCVQAVARKGWFVHAEAFGQQLYALDGTPPNWLAGCLTRQPVQEAQRPWWQIPDFDPAVGDIKTVWEFSRFDWVLACAQHAALGNGDAVERLNAWLTDWLLHNPPYFGPNWKCGQEASIRVMHLAMAVLVLGQVRSPAQGLRDLVRLHLQRITPTVQYAMAQDNNHGTSEAAALFIGGSWLAALGEPQGEHWARTGRHWLENRAVRLIGANGSFSQYSLNYHRVMLDTFCMAEVWRRHLGLAAFSARWQSRALAATQWLRHMVNPINGDGPNVGANDGARLLQLADTAYRDYRPSVQLAMALFAGQRAYAHAGGWDDALDWLGVERPQEVAPPAAHYVADDGGFAVLRQGKAMAMLRYPRFQFRPSQADALHLDMWVGEENLLRDAGTYSYNTEPQWLNYFGGTASHNTVQFDNRDQMPRLSRFLLGNWLKTRRLFPLAVDDQHASFGAGYRDGGGACHVRQISLGAGQLRVVDEVAGFHQRAVLRWRLRPGLWSLEQAAGGGACVARAEGGALVLKVSSSVAVVRCELVQGWESGHYLEKTEVPVLEIEIGRPGTLTTELGWAT